MYTVQVANYHSNVIYINNYTHTHTHIHTRTHTHTCMHACAPQTCTNRTSPAAHNIAHNMYTQRGTDTPVFTHRLAHAHNMQVAITPNSVSTWQCTCPLISALLWTSWKVFLYWFMQEFSSLLRVIRVTVHGACVDLHLSHAQFSTPFLLHSCSRVLAITLLINSWGNTSGTRRHALYPIMLFI